MNRIILKNSVKEIKKSYRRFLSLLLISMLGVGFFAGVKATTPDMQKTIDAYFDKEKLFDVKVVSTLGLTNEDVEKVKEIDGISDVYGIYSKDVFVNVDDVDIVVKVIELTSNINNVKLIEGRLPKEKNECVVEHQMIARENIKIGDKITAKIIRVRGNCDAVSDLPAETVLKVGETDFLITHGNLYGVKRGLLSLALRARELACAYALYGHTHTASAQQSQGVTLINPGAMSGFSPSYALIEGDGILFHVDFFTPKGGEKNVKK